MGADTEASLDEAGASSMPSLRQVGDTLNGTYRIVRRIGAGGMADVFEVEHLRLGCRFAAKVLRATARDDPAVRRFLREARLLAGLKSDHIVTVFDVSAVDEDNPFYVMERLQGTDLRQVLKGAQRLSASRAAKLVLDACRGVTVAHGAGIVHRDLKPENLFVTHRDTGEEVCKLLDFGVVKADGGTSTQHGTLVGTLRYMAPEQLEHAGVVGPRSDVRSLGAILYECLAGRPAFDADSFERLAYQVLNQAPAPLGPLRPDLPPGLDAVVSKALERDPARRFGSAQALGEALEAYAESTRDLSNVSTESSLEASLPLSPGRPLRQMVRLAGGAIILACVLAWALAPGSQAAVELALPAPSGIEVAHSVAPPIRATPAASEGARPVPAPAPNGPERIASASRPEPSPAATQPRRIVAALPVARTQAPRPAARINAKQAEPPSNPAPSQGPRAVGIVARNPYDPE